MLKRSGYQPYMYGQRRNTHEWYKTQERLRKNHEQSRRGRAWGDDDGDHGQRRNNHDRNGYNPYQR
jgi:hypothetical protein